MCNAFPCMYKHIICDVLTGVCSVVYPIHYDSDPWNVITSFVMYHVLILSIQNLQLNVDKAKNN